MKDVTIIVQGRITHETFNFYLENYSESIVILSTWVTHNLDLTQLPKSWKVVLQPLPEKKGVQNQNLQYTSTLNGLMNVETPYVIKLRGDERFSNLEYILDEIKTQPNKIHCSSIWFRHWSFMKYHISDHIIAGKTKLLKLMFTSAKHNFDNSILNYWEPEIMLTRSYLMEKETERFDTVDGRILMIENFNILDIKNLEPYFIVANIFRKRWVNSGYIPERNYSISNVNRLLLSKEKAYDLEIKV